MEELLGIFITNVVISLPAQPSVGQTVVQEFPQGKQPVPESLQKIQTEFLIPKDGAIPAVGRQIRIQVGISLHQGGNSSAGLYWPFSYSAALPCGSWDVPGQFHPEGLAVAYEFQEGILDQGFL